MAVLQVPGMIPLSTCFLVMQWQQPRDSLSQKPFLMHSPQLKGVLADELTPLDAFSLLVQVNPLLDWILE
jgi:hypothetical protein